MSKPKIINIEGRDGAGKTTVINELINIFEENSIPFKTVHFPSYDENSIYGNLIMNYLHGIYDNLDPILTATLYAGDRLEQQEKIKQYLDKGYNIILDRYFYSNVAYQSARLNIPLKSFLKWANELEFNINKILKPDLVIYLSTPSKITEKRLNEKDKDFHEKNSILQEKAHENYLALKNIIDNYKIINTYDSKNNIYPVSIIAEKIKDLIDNI